MSSRSPQQGFALALLLWMIAGMSLMVAAVIHFARADIAMAELRLHEAKAEALSRGAALLALRDIGLGEVPGAPTVSDARDSEAEDVASQAFGEKRYSFPGGISVTAATMPVSALLSLNGATVDELYMMFTEAAEMPNAAAIKLVDGVVLYRQTPPGFRFREELLATQGASYIAYDRLKDFVHPFRPQATQWDLAGGPLSGMVGGIPNTNAAGDGAQGAGARLTGEVTFESIAQSMRERRGGESSMIMVTTTVEGIQGRTASYRLWCDQQHPGAIRRTLRVSAVASRDNAL